MIIDELFEAPQPCPECGGISFSDLILAEKKDACYYKVKASAKVWPSAYASGRLVQCRKKGAGNYGNKSEGVAEEGMLGRSKYDKRYLDKFDPTEVMNISDDPEMKAHRTTRQGSLRTSKKDLEFAFGPSGEDDTWVLEFRNGLIATVYPNPNSNFGMDWFIGGNHPDIEDYVLKAYSAAINDLEEGVAEGSLEEIDRRGFLKGAGAAAVAGAGGSAGAEWVNRGTKKDDFDDSEYGGFDNESTDGTATLMLGNQRHGGQQNWNSYLHIRSNTGSWRPFKPAGHKGPVSGMWGRIRLDDNPVSNVHLSYSEGNNWTMLTVVPESGSASDRNFIQSVAAANRVRIELPARRGDEFAREILEFKKEKNNYDNVTQNPVIKSAIESGKFPRSVYDQAKKAGYNDNEIAEYIKKTFKESVNQGVAEGLAQDEAEEYSGWRAEFVNEINYNTFEVKLTNTRSKESANFIVRPVDMVSYGPTLSIETMDVHDLQTGQTESWTNDDPAPEGPIAYAISGLFYDDKQLQQKLQNIIDTHDTKGQDMMPGLEKRRSIGQEVDADAYIDSQEKTQAAMAKMKKGVAEKLGDNRPKLGSKRDSGRSIRKWRSARGLDETGVAEGELDEGWKSALGAAALAGTMAMGAGGASARVMPGDDPGINRLTGKPIATQQATDTAPAKAEAPQGFSKEYLQKAANPDRFGRFLISVEKAQELLKQMNEGVAEEAPPGDKAERMVRHIKKSYAKDGKITDKEKGIAYATAWKAHNSGKLEEQNMSDEQATLQAKLQELEKQYDPSFEYSDDYRVWTQQKGIQNQINSIKQQLARLNETAPKEKEADYGDDYQDMVARVKKLAGLGPLKTVYDPQKRVYRNVPTAVQPKK